MNEQKKEKLLKVLVFVVAAVVMFAVGWTLPL